MAASEPRSARPIDVAALAQVRRRLQRAAEPPWLHAEVARRMAERLPLILRRPRTVIDWQAFLGAGGMLLRQAYPQARLLPVEPDAQRRAAAAASARPWWQRLRTPPPVPAPLDPAALVAGQGELLWANMVLHAVGDPPALMREWHRVLAVDGFLMFSTLGPGSLTGLRSLYAEQGWPTPFAPFVDMHDLGDMLLEAGFADPVMDQETLTLSWPSGSALLAELRTLGGNVDPRRGAGLRTPRWRRRLEALLDSAADARGRVALPFEIVYGHAFRGLPRPRVAAQTAVPLDDLRTMARAGRRHP
ncbi:MAG: biotin synthase [Burkholderiales bacterium]|nr:biotin synthase [Burkholderiales bacterium]